MIIHSGSHEVVKIMGHDVKQFKSLEGFLESGPQFVLQAYIILSGHKEGIEDFDRVQASKLKFVLHFRISKKLIRNIGIRQEISHESKFNSSKNWYLMMSITIDAKQNPNEIWSMNFIAFSFHFLLKLTPGPVINIMMPDTVYKCRIIILN